ncbi:hypothetical protein RRG08_033934 [Elysia crispata]|uniref:Ig-like domain-containing protein n=1 Tax=Elysia crispata TaxID=231223 RepID=A0AAE0YBF4_9GAST|nr:hypothetical protein RRG08_033934 [Elysia crispata]
MEISRGSPFVYVLLVVLGSHSGVSANDDWEDRVEELEVRLGQVEERLDKQEEFASDVHEAFPSVFQNAGNYSSNGTSANNRETAPTTTAPTTTPFVYTRSDFVATVLDVKRETMATGYRFTVRYIPHAQNLRVVYVFDSVMSQNEVYCYLHELDTTSESNGVKRVTLERGFVSGGQFDNTYVYFMTESESVGIKVDMDPGVAGNLSSSVHAWPFTLSPDELVYRQGQDTPLLDIRYTNSTNAMTLHVVMINLTSGEAIIADNLDHSSFFDTTISTKYNFIREKTIQGRLKTSRYRISGFVSVIATKYLESYSSAVEVVKVEKRIVFRPENQAGPFPDGYLGFGTVQGSRYTDDRTQIYICNITDGNPCREIVFVLSESPTQLTCHEIMRNEQIHPLAVTPPSDLEFNSDVRKYLFQVQPTTDLQNFSLVQCTAVNETGFHVVKQIKVLYFVQPRILVDKSSVQNGSMVTVTCVATGHPLPRTMTVTVRQAHLHDVYSTMMHYTVEEEDTVTSPDGQEVSGVVTFQQNPVKPLVSVFCSVSTGFEFTTEEGHTSYSSIAADHSMIFGS